LASGKTPTTTNSAKRRKARRNVVIPWYVHEKIERRTMHIYIYIALPLSLSPYIYIHTYTQMDR
jgi:hypothetical protein